MSNVHLLLGLPARRCVYAGYAVLLLGTGACTRQSVPPADYPEQRGRVLLQLPGGAISAPYVAGLTISPDGKALAACGADGCVHVCDLATGHEVHVVKVFHNDALGLAYSPDGRTLAACGGGEGRERVCLQIWRPGGREAPVALGGPAPGISCVTFSPKDGTLVAGTAAAGVQLWDIARRSSVTTLEEPAAGDVRYLSFSPDGRYLAAGGRSALHAGTGPHFLSVWHLATRQKQTPFPRDVPRCFIFSPRAGIAASGNFASAEVWDTTTWKRRIVLEPVQSVEFTCLAFSPDGHTLLAGAQRGTTDLGAIAAWAVDTGKLLTVVWAHRGGVTSLSVTPDGKSVASGGNDGLVQLWDMDGLVKPGPEQTP
jgi:WD40 repeat protein